MALSERDLLDTARELRAQVRARAGLAADWEQASAAMRDWYLRLARRAEGMEQKQ
jgi:hypothetical protein